MEKINIYWGADKDFEIATDSLGNINFLVDVINHINKTDVKIEGISEYKDLPLKVENLLVHTDDYGGVREWALLGFSNNILRNSKVEIKNLWLCNPPKKIYEDILKNFKKEIIKEYKTDYPKITIDDMQKMYDEFDEEVIGQPHVMKHVLSSIYALRSKTRKRPVTLLFLGDSGIGKTETAKYISSCLKTDMVRISSQCNKLMKHISIFLAQIMGKTAWLVN